MSRILGAQGKIGALRICRFVNRFDAVCCKTAVLELCSAECFEVLPRFAKPHSGRFFLDRVGLTAESPGYFGSRSGRKQPL